MRSRTKRLIKKNFQQLLFIFSAFFLMVSVSYFYVSNIVQNQVYMLGEATMDTVETAVTASLHQTEIRFANMVRDVEALVQRGESNETVRNYLQDIHNEYVSDQQNMPDFMKIYGYFDKEFLDGSDWVPPADYNPVERPWYVGAVQDKTKIYFSEPYIDADTGEMCISFSKQIADSEGIFYGVLALDLRLSRITDYVETQQLDHQGYGVLISNTLHFTSHQNSALLGGSVREAGKGYSHLADLLEARQPVSAERFSDVDGTDSIAFFRTIFNGWHIGLIIPRSNYYGQVYQMAIALLIMGIVLMCALSYLLIRSADAKMRSDEESRSKSTFLARMSHEMRTPMNAIIGMSDIARKTDDSLRVRYCLDKISDASSHLLGVINDVLDMSKIEAGKLELSYTDFALAEALNRAVAIVSFKLVEKKQELGIKIHPDVPKAILSDMQRLTQVITNLLSNANKFTHEGGMISISVDSLGERDGVYELRFEVADNGIGISPEQQAILFTSFEQADGSISRKYGGTGLGLAISQNIVNMMGGKIWIESELGEGARFIFVITARAGEVSDQVELKEISPALAEADTETPVFTGKHILLAEDIEINREILMDLLADTGVTFDYAENGKAAVEIFAADPDKYDLIFMDVHMPEVDGYTATRQIRSIGTVQARNIPIVAMTANVFREDIEKCLAVGMNAHVGKPIDKYELQNVMRQFII